MQYVGAMRCNVDHWMGGAIGRLPCDPYIASVESRGYAPLYISDCDSEMLRFVIKRGLTIKHRFCDKRELTTKAEK